MPRQGSVSGQTSAASAQADGLMYPFAALIVIGWPSSSPARALEQTAEQGPGWWMGGGPVTLPSARKADRRGGKEGI